MSNPLFSLNRAGFTRFSTALSILACIFITGCQSVSPWERGNLAKPQMAMEPYPMLNEMRGHNFGSREAAAGSASGGGGGCGCY